MDNLLFQKYLVDTSSKNFLINMTEQLKKVGFVTVDRIESSEKMLRIAESLGDILIQDDTNDRGIKGIHWPNGGAGSFYHTDRASMARPPNIVFVVCRKQAAEGGYSLFVDGKELHKILKTDHPGIVAKLFEPETTVYGFMPPHVSTGSIFNKSEDGSIFLKFRFDYKGGYFSSAILHYIPIFIDYVHKLSFSFQLQENQGYLVQNGRWLHGANPFHGERAIYRIILHSNIKTLNGDELGFGFNEE